MSRMFPKSWEGKWPNLDRWIAEGEMKKQPIMERVYRCASFWDDEKEIFEKIFASASTHHEDGNPLLTEPAFISLLTSKGFLPESPESVRAGKTTYAIVAYFGTLPLPIHQYDPNLRLDGLDRNHLTLGLIHVIPGRINFRDRELYAWGRDDPSWQEHDTVHPRSRTPHLKRIFQSLSSPYEDKIQHGTESCSTHSADAQSLDFSSRHQDDPEDAIIEHLVDVLHSTQYIHDPIMAPVDWEKFNSSTIAQQLVTENEIPPFSSLAIPAERFEELVKVLLYLQYSTPELLPALSEFSGAASSICAGFLQGSSKDLITWSMFERGMKITAPHLFDALYRLLLRNFLGKERFINVDSGSNVFIGPPKVLTIPLASQLYTILAGCVYFADLECFHHFTCVNMPTSAAFISALESVPDEAIMILSGTTANGGAVTFGIYSYKPKLDGSSIQENLTENTEVQQRCTLFQLAPVHDMFVGVVGRAGWKCDEESTTFGEGGGVMMVLKDQFSRGEVKHQVSDGDQMKGTYEANPFRGDWTVEFEIKEIAIWSEYPLEE